MNRSSVVWIASLVLACGASPGVAVQRLSSTMVRTPGPLEVGVERVDITPPPGVSTFGHGPDAHVTNGYWTRLYCRVFVLQTSPDNRVALIPCDLPAIGALLHQKVTDLLEQKVDGACSQPAGAVVPPWRVMISATHTHAGPGHYFESFAYTGITSTRLPGFDPDMLSFLATRIADGVRKASCAMHPARARWAHDKVWGLTRNRSLLSYAANPTHPDFGQPPQDPDSIPEEAAVDPRLDVLQLESVDTAGAGVGPLGWLVFFAMHPTVLPNTNRLLGGDTHGTVSRILEEELRRKAGTRTAKCLAAGGTPTSCAAPVADPLAGVFNTNEGDISPKWIVGNLDETIHLARRLADTAASAHAGPWRRNLELDAHSLQVHLPGAWLMNAGNDPEAHLCKTPELGNAAGHGAADHPTSVDSILPSESDIDPARSGCQKPKRKMLGFLQRALLGREETRFPSDVFFGMVRIGDMWLSFMPAELTVHTGELVNQRVKRIAGAAFETRIVGLSNSYIGYITTAPEYALQRYEGGFTLYGPRSAEFAADRAEILARATLGQRLDGVDETRPLEYELGPTRHRLPHASDETSAAELGQERKAGGLCRLRDTISTSICFWWTDVGPATALSSPAPWLELVDDAGAKVHVCSRWHPSTDPNDCDPAGAIDDLGIDFRTSIRGRSGDGFRWGTIFRPSDVEWQQIKGPTRIQVRGTGGAPPILSPAFSLSDLPRDCSYEEAANCVVD